MKQVQQVLQNLIECGRVPGLAIQVNCRGKLRMQYGFGLSDIEKKRVVDPTRTLFRAGSISKSITATALLALVKESKIALDDKVVYFVPEFENSEVSIRNLAGHSSGIRGYRGKELLLNVPMSFKAGLNLFKDDALQFTPGSDFLYSTYNFVLLALAMERASGTSFEHLIRDYVFRPFGMHSTIPEVSDGSNGRCATFYYQSTSGFILTPPLNTRFKLGGGGFLTTVEDLCLFGQHILNQYTENSSEIRSFLQPQRLKNQWIPYGLGWQLSSKDAKRNYFGHEGTAVGGRGLFWVFPDLELVIALLCNSTRPDFETEISLLVEEICCAAETEWFDNN